MNSLLEAWLTLMLFPFRGAIRRTFDEQRAVAAQRRQRQDEQRERDAIARELREVQGRSDVDLARRGRGAE